jgi:hypothetical protein
MLPLLSATAKNQTKKKRTASTISKTIKEKDGGLVLVDTCHHPVASSSAGIIPSSSSPK